MMNKTIGFGPRRVKLQSKFTMVGRIVSEFLLDYRLHGVRS